MFTCSTLLIEVTTDRWHLSQMRPTRTCTVVVVEPFMTHNKHTMQLEHVREVNKHAALLQDCRLDVARTIGVALQFKQMQNHFAKSTHARQFMQNRLELADDATAVLEVCSEIHASVHTMRAEM